MPCYSGPEMPDVNAAINAQGAKILCALARNLYETKQLDGNPALRAWFMAHLASDIYGARYVQGHEGQKAKDLAILTDLLGPNPPLSTEYHVGAKNGYVAILVVAPSSGPEPLVVDVEYREQATGRKR